MKNKLMLGQLHVKSYSTNLSDRVKGGSINIGYTCDETQNEYCWETGIKCYTSSGYCVTTVPY